MNRLIVCGLIFCFLSTSCYYDNKEDLYEIVIVEGEVDSCNIESLSFNADIFPIIDVSCNGACHNAVDQQGGIVLESHGQILPYVNNGTLLGSIKHESGFAAMPEGGKLDNCPIDQIESWIMDGAPNN